MPTESKLVKFIKFGLYLVLFTPFVFGHSFMYPFISLKVFIFQFLVEVIFALWLALIIFYKEYRPKITMIRLAFLIFLAVIFLSSVFGIDFHRSLWSTQARSIGFIALVHFAALFFILSSLGRYLDLKKYFTVSFFVSSIISLMTILVSFKLFGTDSFLGQSSIRPGTFFGNPSFLAAYLLPHIFIGFWLLVENKGLRLRFLKFSLLGLGIILTIVALFITQTRGAILGLGAGLVALLIYFSFSRKVRLPAEVLTKAGIDTDNYPYKSAKIRINPRLISIVLLTLIVLFSTAFVFTRNIEIWQKIPGVSRFADLTKLKTGNEPRLITWSIAWKSFLSRPILGYGFENFKYPFDRYYDPKLLRFNFEETYFDKPHNVLFEYLVNGGMVVFLSYVFLFFALFFAMFRSKLLNRFLPFGIGLVIAYIVQNLFLFDTFGSYLVFFVVAAFIDSVYAQEKKGVSEKYVVDAPKYLKPAFLIIFIFLSLIPIYFLNYRSVYANNKQYWGLNYFLNRLSQDALDSYFLALTTPNPYLNEARKDLANNISEIYMQGIEIPEIEKVSAKAMEEFAKAIRKSPNDYFLRVNFADLAAVFYVFDEDYLKLAEEQLNLAFKLSPNRQQVYYSLAKLKTIKGDLNSAKALMEKAVALDPKAPDPHIYYGFVLLKSGDEVKGFEEIEKAKALGWQPKSANDTRILANYYGEAGNYKEAIYWYLEAIGRNRRDLESWLKLGIVYFYNGEKDKAREAIKLVLDEKPDFRNSPNFDFVKPVVESLGL
ncbi:MAG: O-antigen ligase family protein [Patescibacteria group bacterium]|nr:O-antigen ligase family protein [Patescibacteria group bacterium]